MSLDQVKKWLTLVANFGVIGGMVLVAMQMSLATEAINQQSDIELSKGIAAGELAFMGESTATAWAVALFHPAELNEVQVGQVWAYLNNTLLSVQQTWLSNREGMASDATWARARVLGASYLNFGVGRIWWQEYKWGFEPDFVDEINSELAKSDPPSGILQVTKKMLEEIHQLEHEPAMIPDSQESSLPLLLALLLAADSMLIGRNDVISLGQKTSQCRRLLVLCQSSGDSLTTTNPEAFLECRCGSCGITLCDPTAMSACCRTLMCGTRTRYAGTMISINADSCRVKTFSSMPTSGGSAMLAPLGSANDLKRTRHQNEP